MSDRWRKVIDLVAFVLVVILTARLKFELHYSWSASTCFAAAVAAPFVVSRLWTKYTFLRNERTATGVRRRHRLNSKTAEVA